MRKTRWTLLIVIFAITLSACLAWIVLAHRGDASQRASTATEIVNAAIDDLVAVSDRLLELPLYLLLAAAGLVGAVVAFGIERRSPKRALRVLFVAGATVVLFGLALLADRRNMRLQDQSARLQDQIGTLRVKLKAAAPQPASMPGTRVDPSASRIATSEPGGSGTGSPELAGGVAP